MSVIVLRPAADEDFEFLYRVYASTRQEELAVTGWTDEEKERFLQEQFGFQHLHYMKNYEGAEYFIIVSEGKQAGRLYLHRTGEDIRIMDIALLPEFRRRGIGSGILRDLIKEADSRRATLSLHVEFNNPILPFYERNGFRKEGETGIYVFMVRKGSKQE